MDINKFNTLLGYEKTLPPMRAARTMDTLEKCYRYSILDKDMNETKEIMTEAEFIVYSLQNGRELNERIDKPCSKCQVSRCIDAYSCTKGKTKYSLWNEKYGTEITKTGYDFALWLISEELLSFEKVQERIDTETAAKEKTEQETGKKEQEQKIAEESEQEAKEQYKKWLEETTKNYGSLVVDPYVKGITEGEKVLIMRDIFLDIIGHCEEHAKTLLVLIDNIGSLRCRRDLINRLHNGNVASIKTFEHITGIKLAKNYKERCVQLETITKADYKKSKQYKSRKKSEQTKQAAYTDIFYKYQKSENGNTFEFVESQGRLWKYNGYDFYITYVKINRLPYSITEGKTGLIVARENTLKEAKDAAKEITKNMRRGKPMDKPFAEVIEQTINKNGISPLYKKHTET